MTHKRGYNSALGEIGVGFSALDVDLNVLNYGVSYRTSKNGSAVRIAVCVYGKVFDDGSFADKSE